MVTLSLLVMVSRLDMVVDSLRIGLKFVVGLSFIIKL